MTLQTLGLRSRNYDAQCFRDLTPQRPGKRWRPKMLALLQAFDRIAARDVAGCTQRFACTWYMGCPASCRHG